MPSVIDTASPDTGEAQRSLGGGDVFSSIAKQIMAERGSRDKELAGRTKQIEASLSDVDKATNEMQTKLGELSKNFDEQINLIKNEKPPQANITPPLEAFGRTAAVVGALAGLLTRHPLMTGLNAAASAITSIRQGDWDNYQIQYRNWKVNTDHALEVFKLQNDQLKSVLDADQLSVGQKLQKIRMLGQLNSDKIQASAADTGDLQAVATLYQARQTLGQNAALRAADIETQNVKLQAVRNLKAQPDFQKLMKEHPDQALKKLAEVTNPGVIAAEERGKLTSLKQQQAQQSKKDELSAITDQIDALQGILKKASDVAGAKGVLEHWWNSTAGQITGGFPNRREFEARMNLLQTQLQSKYLNSRYFSRSALSRMEELIPGLSALEGPADASQHLQSLKDLINGQIKEGMPSGEFSDMPDDEFKRLYKEKFGVDLP